jgi:alkanesulfonate monooxygenase SsuD/methylene tetrahydromethanopterin reductase-like flavin-dependent oxidoreductase (luciferase family)
MLLIPALAAATTDLHFAVTSSTTFEEPYANARRFATLDHLTDGRIGWNVVTTSSAVVAELFGRQPVPHDER